MRIVFAGTPAFAVPALDALRVSGHEMVGVLSQPDRPVGRGRRMQAPLVALRARALGLPVLQPSRLDGDAISKIRSWAPDVMVVVAYGLILTPDLLTIPRHGCVNIHASVLPRWRGAAPIVRAIQAGDTDTGITIMRMDAGLDTGPMLLTGKLPIGPDETAGELERRLARLGADLIVEALQRLARDELAETPQPAAGTCYARKVETDDARLDWSRPADELARAVRAFNPRPAAWSEVDGERVRILRARALPDTVGGPPGMALSADADGLRVATGHGVLLVTELQRAGGRALPAATILRGWDVIGRRFGRPTS